MIVEDVRIKEKSTVVGHQHEESLMTYYDVQIFVFNKWWSHPEQSTNLDKAMKLRDFFLDSIKGRRG